MMTQNMAQNKETQRWMSLGTKVGAGLAKVWAVVTGHSGYLLDLNVIQANCSIVEYYYTGLQTVSLGQIRGSASTGRCHDFDANFRLLRDHNESRLTGVETARRRGTKLPPVSLIQVGDMYFVEDGHHRISVAKARGEQFIEAEVTVWRVTGALPWGEPKMALA